MWFCRSEHFHPRTSYKIQNTNYQNRFHLRSLRALLSLWESGASLHFCRVDILFLDYAICVSKETNNVCLIFLFFSSFFLFKTILFHITIPVPSPSPFLSVLNTRFLIKKLIGKNILKIRIFIKYEKKRQFPCFRCLKGIWECLWLQTTRRIYSYYFSTPWSEHRLAN